MLLLYVWGQGWLGRTPGATRSHFEAWRRGHRVPSLRDHELEDHVRDPDQVWRVLADGWLHPLWVVGASRMREVDATWPEAGSRLHHSVGVWPLLIDDSTEVTEVVPESRLSLRARAWPAGEAVVTMSLSAKGGRTEVTIDEDEDEDAVSGPGVLVPKPLRAALIRWRNVETLRRLAFLAERRE